MKRIDLWLSAIAFLAVQTGAPVTAQTTEGMTEAEISAAFAKQKTRGLSIVPNAEATAVPAEKVAIVELPVDEQVYINIRFDFDSSVLRLDQKPLLVNLCNAMKTTNVQLFRIVGHADSSGSAGYNESLSRLRAEEVKRHLETDCGIPPDKMEAVGVGARYPFDPVNPRADVNRRVEFQALS